MFLGCAAVGATCFALAGRNMYREKVMKKHLKDNVAKQLGSDLKVSSPQFHYLAKSPKEYVGYQGKYIFERKIKKDEYARHIVCKNNVDSEDKPLVDFLRHNLPDITHLGDYTTKVSAQYQYRNKNYTIGEFIDELKKDNIRVDTSPQKPMICTGAPMETIYLFGNPVYEDSKLIFDFSHASDSLPMMIDNLTKTRYKFELGFGVFFLLLAMIYWLMEREEEKGTPPQGKRETEWLQRVKESRLAVEEKERLEIKKQEKEKAKWLEEKWLEEKKREAEEIQEKEWIEKEKTKWAEAERVQQLEKRRAKRLEAERIKWVEENETN